MGFVVAEVVSVAPRVPERPAHGDLARSPRALGAYRTVHGAGGERLTPDSAVRVAPRVHGRAGPSAGLAPAVPRAPRGTGFVGFAPGPSAPVTPWVARGPRGAGFGTSRTLRGAGPVVGLAPGSSFRTVSLPRGEAVVPDGPALMPGAHPVLAGPSVDVPRADRGNGGEAPGSGKGRGRGRAHPRHPGPRQCPGDHGHFRHRHPGQGSATVGRRQRQRHPARQQSAVGRDERRRAPGREALPEADKPTGERHRRP